MKNSEITVAVGLSGGVDSALAAAILKNQGYNVVGITMSVYSGEKSSLHVAGHACYGPGEKDDIELAASVAGFLSIPHYVIDLKEEYREFVLEYFKEEYLIGRTPNPCTRCNPVVKFGFMLQKAVKAGISFDLFATGHYARVCYLKGENRYVIKMAVDKKKDQTYFLYGLKQELISSLMFPVGGFTKEEVRKYSKEMNIPVFSRQESQDFIEGGDYSVLFDADKIKPGPFIDMEGHCIGTHRGIVHYTIGQRRGIGISHSEPLYVVKIDTGSNTVTVGPKSLLYSDTLIADNLNFISIDLPESPVRVQARIRHNHIPADAHVIALDKGRVKVVFDNPQLSITPGQSIVFYGSDDILVGGGIISRVS